MQIRPYIIVLWLLMLSIHLQTVSLQPVAEGDRDEDATVKLIHIVAALMGGWVLTNYQAVRERLFQNPMTLAFLANGVMVCLGQIFIAWMGETGYGRVSPVMFKFVFAFYCLLIGYDVSTRLSQDQVLFIARVTFGLALVAVLIKGIIYFQELKSPPTWESWKPDIPLFYGGGVNLEATMMVLGATLFVGRRSFYPFLAGAFVVSALYFSRAAFVGCLVCLVLVHFNPMRVNIVKMLAAVVLCAIGITWLYLGDHDFFLNRLSTVGEDSSSQTRLRMLSGTLDAAKHWPLGYGPGNAIYALEAYVGDVHAGNAHNVYVQVLLDYGVQGLIFWLALVVRHIMMVMRYRLDSPIGLFLLVYFVLSLIQFTALDNYFWLFLGIFQGYAVVDQQHRLDFLDDSEEVD